MEGFHFYSVTVRGFKFEKRAGCQFLGHHAIYRGPFKSVIDDEGHLFPRDEAVEVCTDTVAKLQSKPYSHLFTIVSPSEAIVEMGLQSEACTPGEGEGQCC